MEMGMMEMASVTGHIPILIPVRVKIQLQPLVFEPFGEIPSAATKR